MAVGGLFSIGVLPQGAMAPFSAESAGTGRDFRRKGLLHCGAAFGIGLPRRRDGARHISAMRV
jgi:hypothetical protein